MAPRLARALFVASTCLVGCAPDPKRHCEARQAFWERAFADEDPTEAARMGAIFVASCTKNLSGPGAAAELACRDKCLAAAGTGEARGSEAAKSAYSAFSACERSCF